MEGKIIFELLKVELGAEVAYKVFKLFSGQQVYFSSAALKKVRNKMIKEEFSNGASYFELARRYRVSASTVRSICNSSKN